MQTNPTFWRSSDPMLAQGVHFTDARAEHHRQVPGDDDRHRASWRRRRTAASSSTARSRSASPRPSPRPRRSSAGCERREAEGLPTDDMGPVITIMVGRLEDWLRVLVERDGIVVHPAALPWSGVAVFKRAYRIFQERGFRARLLGAAIRHHLHWSEFVGGDVVITMPAVWQKTLQRVDGRGPRSGWTTRSTRPTSTSCARAFPDFVRAYEPDGLTIDEFDSFAPTVRTLRAFIASYHDLLAAVTDAQLPNPDVKSERRDVHRDRDVGRQGGRGGASRARFCATTPATSAPSPAAASSSVHRVGRRAADVRAVRAIRRRGRVQGAHRDGALQGRYVLGDVVPRLERRERAFYTPIDTTSDD